MKIIHACVKCGKFKRLWFWVKPWKTKYKKSHGYCPVCFKEAMAEIEAMPKRVKI